MADIAAHPDANTAGVQWALEFFKIWRKRCEPQASTKATKKTAKRKPRKV